jgi:hypothetical protein
MNGLALLGIVLIFYALAVLAIAIKKPKTIWEMKKIQMFIKYLGEEGTVYFFYFWSLLAAGIGIWLLIK